MLTTAYANNMLSVYFVSRRRLDRKKVADICKKNIQHFYDDVREVSGNNGRNVLYTAGDFWFYLLITDRDHYVSFSYRSSWLSNTLDSPDSRQNVCKIISRFAEDMKDFFG